MLFISLKHIWLFSVIAQETDAFVPLWHKFNTYVTVQIGILH